MGMFMQTRISLLLLLLFFFGDSIAQQEDDDIPEEEFPRVQNMTSQLEKAETNPCSVSKKQGAL